MELSLNEVTPELETASFALVILQASPPQLENCQNPPSFLTRLGWADPLLPLMSSS